MHKCGNEYVMTKTRRKYYLDPKKSKAATVFVLTKQVRDLCSDLGKESWVRDVKSYSSLKSKK